MFLDRRCPVCRRPARFVCARCWGDLTPAGPLVVPGLSVANGLYRYDDAVQRIVVAAKNGGRRDLLRVMGRALAHAVVADRSFAQHPRFDLVSWVPASPTHRRERGYDQGRVLARLVGRQMGVPTRGMLARSGAAQHGRDRRHRLVGPELSPLRPAPPRILLVDDVATTGASLGRAAAVLRSAGADDVVGHCFAAAQRAAESAISL